MFKAEIVADSLSPQGHRLVSVLCTFPRIILAEVNTHRMLSKNTSSSRAIPFAKMVASIEENPFIPIAWQKDHSGMQGTEYLDTNQANVAEARWLLARDNAIRSASKLNGKGDTDSNITKQLANRLLEPFMWTTMLITGSLEGGWDNFFNLRCPAYQHEDGSLHRSREDFINYERNTKIVYSGIRKDKLDWLKCNKGAAEIHMMYIAELIYDAFNESTPKQLKAGEWHIPFDKQLSEIKVVAYGPRYRVKVSTAMGARTSYTIVGDEKEINVDSLIKLDDKLLAQQPPHSSPMEHCSRAMTDHEYKMNVKGEAAGYTNGDEDPYLEMEDDSRGWCRNYRGFIQRRYLIENGQDI